MNIPIYKIFQKTTYSTEKLPASYTHKHICTQYIHINTHTIRQLINGIRIQRARKH